jgi:hypothetical protein
MPRNLFVGVGHQGLRIVSENGSDWKQAQTGKEGEIYIAVCAGNGRFAAVGSYGGANIFAASTDGLAWKTATQDAKYVKYIRGLTFGKESFLGVGGDPGAVGSSEPFGSFSTDGLSWTALHPLPGKHIIRRVAWGNDRFVGVGDRGRRAVSADGKEWKDTPAVKAIDTLVDIAFGNGVFVGVGLHGLRMRTEDGLTWTDRQAGEEGEHLNSVVWAQDRFVAIGMTATYSSRDGVAWKREVAKNGPTTATFGNGVFVGSRWRGRLLRSTDAVEWGEVHKSDHHVEALASGLLP